MNTQKENGNILSLAERVRIHGDIMRAAYPSLRRGQSYMNALYEIDKDVYMIIFENGEVDCFYDDKKIESFFSEL